MAYRNRNESINERHACPADLGTGKRGQESPVPPLDPGRAVRVKRHPGRAKGTKGY